jgi:pimeloyl-ACP methyl ester carboxylesterase
MMIHDEMQLHKCIINMHGEKLHGILHAVQSRDLIIAVHGFASSMEFAPIVDICKLFQKTGVAAFRFNLSGHGTSEGNINAATYTKCAADLDAVISYFHDRGYYVKSVVAHSAGASSTIIQSARDSRIGSVMLIAPRLILANSIIVKAIEATGKTLSQILSEPDTIYPYVVEIKGRKENRSYYFNKEYLEELRDLDIFQYLKQIQVPIAMSVGTLDDNVTQEELHQASIINTATSLFLIEGAGHTFWRNEHRIQLFAYLMNWYATLR